MRYIKVLSMFVILTVALLLISTIRTYAGSEGLIFDCDGDQLISKSTDTGGVGNCAIDENCEVGDSCANCIDICLDSGSCIPDDELTVTGGGGKTRVFILCPD